MKTLNNKTTIESEGYEVGEVCNRNNCKGTIEAHAKDGSCSCHINPPCGYCTEAAEYCPLCEWDAREEQLESEKLSSKNTDNSYWEEQRKQSEERKNRLYLMMQGKLPITEFDYISESHTHFSMIKKGVYPDGMSSSSVLEKVRGTFGGRFTRFGNNVFEYIAYTD